MVDDQLVTLIAQAIEGVLARGIEVVPSQNGTFTIRLATATDADTDASVGTGVSTGFNSDTSEAGETARMGRSW